MKMAKTLGFRRKKLSVPKRFMTLNGPVPLTGQQAHQRTEILLQEFAHLGQKLSAASTPEQAARIILKAADKLLGWDCGYLYFFSPEENRIDSVLIIDIIDGKKTDIPSLTGPAPPTPIIEKVLKEGAQLILRDESDLSSHGMTPFGDTSRLSASIMLVPIREDKKITGFLSIDSYTYGAYDQNDLATLQSLADHCGGALERIGAQEALRASETQLRALAARLQSAREEESIRIAREIHDELGQELTSLKIGLSWLEKKMGQCNCAGPSDLLAEKTRGMVGIVSQTLQSVRRITTQLRPRVLDDLGLAAAIEWQTLEFQSRTGISCETALEENSIALVREHATAIFRIYQEILTNVARHADAARIFISMKKNGDEIILQVRDNGRGITKKEMTGTKSLGLLGMRERTLTFGGSVQIESERKKGTTVTIHIPLARQAGKK